MRGQLRPGGDDVLKIGRQFRFALWRKASRISLALILH